jgi:hypothetical protein
MPHTPRRRYQTCLTVVETLRGPYTKPQISASLLFSEVFPFNSLPVIMRGFEQDTYLQTGRGNTHTVILYQHCQLGEGNRYHREISLLRLDHRFHRHCISSFVLSGVTVGLLSNDFRRIYIILPMTVFISPREMLNFLLTLTTPSCVIVTKQNS